jgi:hypothetical protein
VNYMYRGTDRFIGRGRLFVSCETHCSVM